ncbi:MAG TPA: hypothetical protein VHU40_10780, partial [Polyangia bacterium]|nr:hypothetical protein [Polyangia bacterium]
MEAEPGYQALLLPDFALPAWMLGTHLRDGSVVAVGVERSRTVQLAESVKTEEAVVFLGQKD